MRTSNASVPLHLSPYPPAEPNTVNLLERIRNKQVRVGVIGLGYVGLPLAVEFAKAGLDVTGFDVDHTKVDLINAGTTYIPDVESLDLQTCVQSGRLRATTDMAK